MKIKQEEARAFLIHHHQLDEKVPADKNSILKLFSRLHCIQYDPLNVVGRNPDLVLQARVKNYNPNLFHKMIYEERQFIDGWDKMMSIYPITDWPYFNLIRLRHGQGTKTTLAYRKSLQALDLTDSLLDLIHDDGPLQSSKLTSTSVNQGSWGHGKLASAGLDYLYAIGKISVSNKINTQKIYDLTERIIPSSILNQKPPFHDSKQGLQDFIKWYVLRRIDTMGLLWNKNGGAWLGYYIQKKQDRTPYLKALLKEEKIIPITIEGIKEAFYITKENLTSLQDFLQSYSKGSSFIQPSLRFLAPLDNFLWDRNLIEELYGFRYRWEVYTPLAKREFGYYVLPILYGNRLIGRIEFDYYRKDSPLNIKNTWYEKDFMPDAKYTKALHTELKNFKNYLLKI